jgi:hypothetical protein
MSDYHHRTLLRINKAFGGSDVVSERRERVLNCDDVITVVLQQWYQVLKAARICKGAVDQNDRRLRGCTARCRGRYRLRSHTGCGEE